MLERVRRADATLGFTLGGSTVEDFFRRNLLDNPRVTDAQLLAISQVALEQLATPPELRARVLEKVPEARQLPSHRFTVALMAAVTGLDAQALSEATPDLGLTGSPQVPWLLWAPRTEREQRCTSLHDFTDYLRAAGVQGINAAVWGVESRELSALIVWIESGPWADPSAQRPGC
ncbi:hypothetical protein JY651_20010 [Pyxidicoccus parkwayensis]|uniref:Uncharacterized protein n=2 Tax=Pyxidicoccus parkwayensis TaxID=2813578 RepID=A0ABX7PC94_9BACT|nr:hypothetical protein JY651_20010 [Pyxidicoccus parkwaysis]